MTNTPVSVGYTNDGIVFVQAMIQGPDGQPGKIVFTWEPKQAMQIADWIASAAKSADNPLVVGRMGAG